ncbi:YHYH protein [Chondrinema litorale]|uniref:YHYH protein n=1 Tax=Chondrinema litorale TaxID=2994555 RepID=UPI00254376D7|nr:YHYH protein [Chondrinema litorale]UZR99357.1 YHYH protein [Chondrinema litorale]
MKYLKLPLLFLIGLCLSLISCDDSGDENDIQSEEETCINSVTYEIDNGTACNNTPSASSIYELKTVGNTVEVTFNYIPPHKVLGNVTANQKIFTFTATPTLANETTPVANTSYNGKTGYLGWVFGIAKTGVPFDPVAAEGWLDLSTGDQNYEWNLEVLSSNAGLTYDCNNAHDLSRYHYHGTPIEYIKTIEDGASHSALLGYAADGFPIYYKYGYADPDNANSSIVALTSSYSVKAGCRPGDGVIAPDGAYDGSYVADYEFIDGQGDLDECNGRWAKTPEFPDGTYVYYITDEFPSIPRCFAGTPSEDFKVQP